MNTLENWGWTASLETQFVDIQQDTWEPARIAAAHRDLYEIWTGEGSLRARLSGRLRHLLSGSEEMPTVGDWIAADIRPDEGTATIHGVLPRQTVLIRKEAGARSRGQALAANVDTVFLVTSLNQEFNPRRIERFLSLVYESGAAPVILLNKVDLCDDIESWRTRAEASAPAVPIHSISALTGDGTDDLALYCTAGRTVVLLGSSGVGKSTLVNRLTGSESLAVREIREDDARGRHTTSHRQMVHLPDGGVLIDTPGLREVALWDTSEGVGETFADIAALAEGCRFKDCRHETEPSCAVTEALESGSLDPNRYRSYLKLERELAFMDRRLDRQAQANAKKRWKAITKGWRARKKLEP